MKATKIVVFLIIAIVLGGGFYLFQTNKQNKELAAHNKQKFEQLTKAAKKSGSAGLLVMASAINKYHKVKGHYPKELMHLYPEFIPDRAFISTLNWKYSQGNGTYLVKKNTGGGEFFFSMGPDRRLKSGKGKTTPPVGKIVSADTPKAPKKSPVFMGSKTKTDVKKDTKKLPVLNAFLVNKTKKTDEAKSGDGKKTSVPKPEITIVKKELKDNEKFLLSFDSNKFYIWKTDDGIIGFSNIQYPDDKNLTIFKDKSWIEYLK